MINLSVSEFLVDVSTQVRENVAALLELQVIKFVKAVTLLDSYFAAVLNLKNNYEICDC